MRLTVPFILASSSPRRKHLLEQIGLSFTVIPSPFEEIIPEGMPPDEIVRRLALEKANAIAIDYPDALCLGADTIVVLAGHVLGKPVDSGDAISMLRRLSGHTHTVFTGFALIHPISHRRISAFEATQVTFAEMTDAEIFAYVSSGSPLDKAGAYGIQDDLGALYIERIEGDFFTVMGLPLHHFYRVLRDEFKDLIRSIA